MCGAACYPQVAEGTDPRGTVTQDAHFRVLSIPQRTRATPLQKPHQRGIGLVKKGPHGEEISQFSSSVQAHQEDDIINRFI